MPGLSQNPSTQTPPGHPGCHHSQRVPSSPAGAPGGRAFAHVPISALDALAHVRPGLGGFNVPFINNQVTKYLQRS